MLYRKIKASDTAQSSLNKHLISDKSRDPHTSTVTNSFSMKESRSYDCNNHNARDSSRSLVTKDNSIDSTPNNSSANDLEELGRECKTIKKGSVTTSSHPPKDSSSSNESCNLEFRNDDSCNSSKDYVTEEKSNECSNGENADYSIDSIHPPNDSLSVACESISNSQYQRREKKKNVLRITVKR